MEVDDSEKFVQLLAERNRATGNSSGDLSSARENEVARKNEVGEMVDVEQASVLKAISQMLLACQFPSAGIPPRFLASAL